jgi:prepilin-type processing-associated H-X9-DG protein
MLDGTWDVEYLTSKETVLCPSFAPEKYYNIGRIYGANIGSANSAEFIPAGYTTGPMVKLSRLSSPTAYRFLSDSYSPSANEQSYIVYRWATSSQPGIHLRHFRRANIVFADGHVAGHGESDMEPLEIYRGYSDGCVYMTF